MKWEVRLMGWAGKKWNSHSLDHILPWATHLGSTAAAGVFIASSWVGTGQLRIFVRLVLLYAILLAMAYSLKYLFRRNRPPSSLRKSTKLEIIDPGFPSVHTTCAFMMATLAGHWFPPFRIVFLFVAAFVGWTRVYLGLHFPSDVMAGGVLGYGVTSLFVHGFDLRI